MKICFITSSFPRRDPDNAAPWFRETVLGLRKRGHSVSVFAPAHLGGRQEEYCGAEVFRFRYAPARLERLTHEDSAPAGLKSPLTLLLLLSFMACGTVQALAYFARNRRFGAIDVHWPFPMFVFGLIGKLLTGARLVFHFYASELLLVRDRPLLLRTLRLALRFADGAVAISGPTRALVETLLRPRVPVEVVHYGSLAPGGPPPEHPAPDFGREPFRVLFAGKLIERKGARYLVDALKIMRDGGVAVKLTIVGEGYLRPEIERQVERLGLGADVKFMGFLPEDEVLREFRDCHALAFPSIVDSRGDTEGLGLAPLDAILLGRPAVASAVGGVTDIVVEGRTGYLVPQKDAAALAEKLLAVRADYPAALRLTRAGAEHLRSVFSWEATAARLARACGEGQ